MRGNRSSPFSRALKSGTPPRMRGKRRHGQWQEHLGRNTPAYAGKTVYSHLNRLRLQGTPPRMRGKPPSDLQVSPVTGTPPRMRGKHFTTSAFQSRNPILASLRATTRTLQHAHRTRQTRRNKKRPTGAYVLLTLPDSRQGTCVLAFPATHSNRYPNNGGAGVILRWCSGRSGRPEHTRTRTRGRPRT